MSAEAHMSKSFTGMRMFCRSSDIEGKGIPLFHPLIIPAFIICIVGLVVTIVGWASGMIPLIGALVIVPLSMVYCMGVKSFHNDCGRCCRKQSDQSEVDGAHAQTFVGQENWTIGPASRRAMASPKRIGKRQSQLAAEKEKLKRVNDELRLAENGNAITAKEMNGNTVPPPRSRSVSPSPGKSHTYGTSGGGSLPDVESPSQVELKTSPSATSVVEDEVKKGGKKSPNAPVTKSADISDISDSDSNDESVVIDSDTSRGAESPPGPPTYEEATNKAFVGDNEESR